MFLSAILGLVVFVMLVWLVVGVLFRRGLLLRVALGVVLLVMLSSAALVVSIGQSIRNATSSGTIRVQQPWGPSVMVGPSGVDVRSGMGQGVNVSPLGVHVYNGTRQSVDVGPFGVQVRNQVPADEVAAPMPAVVLPAEAPEQFAAETSPPEPQRLLADHFDPDVYQSEGAAVRGLTGQVAGLLDRVTESRREPAAISIDGKISQPLLVEAMDILTKAYPEAKVSSGADWPARAEGQVVLLYVSKELSPASASLPPGQVTQTLRIDATGAAGKITRTAPFFDKPWVDNFSQFLTVHKGAWVLAMSSGPATSVGEAEDKAMDDAVQKVRPRVLERVGSRRTEGLDHLLDRQIRAGLGDGRMIVDRFVQRFERSYGDLWQVALLIDASPKRIENLAERCERVLAAEQRTFRQTVLSIAGLVAVVCVVYVLLNSVTKGYFAWSLRAAALAVIAGGVYLVLWLA